MPEYLSPGIYIEEVDTGPRPIEGVGTTTAAFVGLAPYSEARDVNTPVLITSWSQYLERFGKPDAYGRSDPHLPGAYLSHAVYGFFQNGGTRCYVTRILPPAVLKLLPAACEIPAVQGADRPALTISADGPIPANLRFAVEYPQELEGKSNTFRLRIQVGREPTESYDLTLGQPGEPATEAPAGVPAPEGTEAAEGGRTKAQVKSAGTAGSARRAALKEFVLGPTTVSLQESSGGRLPRPGTYLLEMPQQFEARQLEQREIVGDASQRTGVNGMEIAEDATMLCFPDLMSPLLHGGDRQLNHTLITAVQQAMITHCERMQDRIAILDTPPGLAAQAVGRWRRDETNYNSMFAALYYPWLTIRGSDGRPMDIPPSGHIAGVYARTDITRGVHKAPANEVIRDVLRVAAPISKGEQDMLNPYGVNCIRPFAGRGVLVWGARTLSDNAAWRYVNVRRLFNYVEGSIERGLQWVVFEPNDPDLWARVRRDVSAFLTGVWREGMLFGRAPAEAFYVKCDEELNPRDVRERGQLIVEVGLAPVRPAEFVIFRFKQWTGGGEQQ
jgi:phage tail sheath protein FI